MKAANKTIVALACAMTMTFTGCSSGETSETSYLDPLIRVDVDESKTETTDIDCIITDLSTKEYDQTVGGNRVGYGISPSTGHFGVVVGVNGGKGVKHVIKYYVTAEDCNGVVCRFPIDELDWKRFEKGGTITVQQVQEYTKGGSPYKPYYSFMGKKLTSIQFISTGEESEEKDSIGDCPQRGSTMLPNRGAKGDK